MSDDSTAENASAEELRVRLIASRGKVRRLEESLAKAIDLAQEANDDCKVLHAKWTAAQATIANIAEELHRALPTSRRAAMVIADMALSAPSSTGGNDTNGYPAIAREVLAEVQRSIEKHGDQRHVPLGTGDQIALLHGTKLAQPFKHIPVTMGTFAYTARNVTDAHSFSQGDGTVTWADILLEEVAEGLAEDDPRRVRAEAVQVAAVAFKIIDAIDAEGGNDHE